MDVSRSYVRLNEHINGDALRESFLDIVGSALRALAYGELKIEGGKDRKQCVQLHRFAAGFDDGYRALTKSGTFGEVALRPSKLLAGALDDAADLSWGACELSHPRSIRYIV